MGPILYHTPMRDLGIIYWPSLALPCVSFPCLQRIKVLIFCEIVCEITDRQDDYIKIPVCQIKDQVKGYLAIQKLFQTDKTGVIRSCSKIQEFRPSCLSQLCQWITFDTGARRGSTLMSKKGLDLLYKWLKPTTCGSRLWPFAAHLKLAQNSKFRDFSRFFLVEIS